MGPVSESLSESLSESPTALVEGPLCSGGGRVRVTLGESCPSRSGRVMSESHLVSHVRFECLVSRYQSYWSSSRQGTLKRDRAMRSVGLGAVSGLRSFGASELRSFGSSELRSFGASELRSFGALELRRCGASEMRSFGASGSHRFDFRAVNSQGERWASETAHMHRFCVLIEVRSNQLLYRKKKGR